MNIRISRNIGLIMPIFLFLLSCDSSVSHSSSLNTEDYNLSFEENINPFNKKSTWEFESQQAYYRIDTITKAHRKSSIMIEAIQRDPSFPCYGNLSNIFKAPEQTQSTVIRFLARNDNIGKIKFQATCRNANEDIIYKDSILIEQNSKWKLYTLRLDGAARFITVRFEFNKDSHFWIDNMKIDFITVNNYHDKKIIHVNPLPERFSNFDSIRTIFIPSQTKIVAIGESLHGSHELALARNEIVKSMILTRGCKYVLLEIGSYIGSQINNYIKGDCSASFLLKYTIETSPFFYINKETADLLVWLRKYNENASEKVNIIGYDVDFEYQEVIRTYLESNKNTSQIYRTLLEKVNSLNEINSLDQTLNSNKNELVKLKGEREFAQLYFWCTELKRLFSVYAYGFIDNHTRDQQMAHIIINTINDLQVRTPIVLCGHLTHLNKISIMTNTTQNIGSILNQYFQNNYYVVALIAGKGSTQLFTSVQEYRNISINVSDHNSLEYQCYLNDSIHIQSQATKSYQGDSGFLSVRCIGGILRNKPFTLGNISKRFDRFVYLPNSEPINMLINESLGEYLIKHDH